MISSKFVLGLCFLCVASPALLAQTVTRSERQLLNPTSQAPNLSFGIATAMTENVAVVGANAASEASIYNRLPNGTWSFEDTLTGSDSLVGDSFGMAVSASGTTIVVGAPSAAGGKGAVYVFNPIFGVWVQTAKLTASDGAAGDGFGSSVSINGNTLIVGAPRADIGPNLDQGAAYIFRNTPGSGFDAGSKITGFFGSAGDWFGLSVATHGDDRAIVGAPYKNSYRGMVYLYETVGAWSLIDIESSLAPHDNELFGWDVDISAVGETDLLWVGAPGTITGGVAAGSVQFFYNDGTSGLFGGVAITPSDGVNAEEFGAAISAHSTSCAVGSTGSGTGSQLDAGCARVYRLEGQVPKLLGAKFVRAGAAASDWLGNSVALYGEHLLAGIIGADIAGSNRGAVAAFKLNSTRGDIDDNGKGDVVWFDPVGGNLCGWIMNGFTRELGGILPAGLGTGAEYCGLADFYGDGRQCALVRQKSNGAFKIFRLSHLTIASSSTISNGISSTWRFLASADINGDGKSDVLLVNGLTGQVNGWLMNGATKLSGGMIGCAAGREFLGTGDFDGSGTDDILWRDSKGNVTIWALSGLSASASSTSGISMSVAVTAVGDLNADGTDDLILRHVGSPGITGTGQVVGWLMHAVSGPTAAVLHPGLPLEWRTEACADLDGDGDDDLIWRHRVNGDVNAWIMNGLTKESGAFVKRVSLSWAILNSDDYNDDHGYDGNGCDDDGDDLNRDDYADDHGGIDADDSSAGGGGGASNGGYVTVSVAAFVGCINAAMAANNLPIIEVEAKVENGAAYIDVLQFNAVGPAVFSRRGASSTTLISQLLFDSSTLWSTYGNEFVQLGVLVLSPATAVTNAAALQPGTLPHRVYLAVVDGVFKWKVWMIGSDGVSTEVVLNAQ